MVSSARASASVAVLQDVVVCPGNVVVSCGDVMDGAVSVYWRTVVTDGPVCYDFGVRVRGMSGTDEYSEAPA
jgi:hypothetical protein